MVAVRPSPPHRLEPDEPKHFQTLASLQASLGESKLAAWTYRDRLTRWQEEPVALCGLWFMAWQDLDGPTAEALEPRLHWVLRRGSIDRLRRVPRYCPLGTPEDWPETLFRHLPTHEVAGVVPALTAPPPTAHGRRIHIGDQSAHFREHATAILAVGSSEAHDWERFEPFAVNLGVLGDDPCRRRCRTAFEHWIDCFGETDAAIALRMRAAGLDVLIDLDARRRTTGHRSATTGSGAHSLPRIPGQHERRGRR